METLIPAEQQIQHNMGAGSVLSSLNVKYEPRLFLNNGIIYDYDFHIINTRYLCAPVVCGLLPKVYD